LPDAGIWQIPGSDLTKARYERLARKLLDQRIDTSQQKKELQFELSEANANTFEKIACELLTLRDSAAKNAIKRLKSAAPRNWLRANWLH
jgi:hypothetical protein